MSAAAAADLLVSGGLVVLPDGPRRVDIAVSGGRVAAILDAERLRLPAADRLDVSGCVVVPGGVDPHVHFSLPITGGVRSQSSAEGSRAAAHGGTTTFIDFANQAGEQSLVEAIRGKKRELAGERPSVDYSLHVILTGEIPFEVIEEVEAAVAEGVASFKMYTAFGQGSALGNLYMDDGRIFGVMEAAGRNRGLVMLHCEDECLVAYHTRRLLREGTDAGRHVPDARPNLAEQAAIRRMLLLASAARVPLYVVHVSTAEGIAEIAEARRHGQAVHGETLHNYLVYTREDYGRPDGLLFHNYPPLRTRQDSEALWAQLAPGGAVDAVGSDDVAVPRETKLRGRRIDDLAGGHNGVETRMQVLFSEGVVRRRLPLTRYAELTSAGAARLFGLYPRKGAVMVGSDADLTVIDPEREFTFRTPDLHSATDFSIWDGWRGRGAITATIARGRVLVRDGEWVGPQGEGEFVPASPAPA